MKYLIIVLLYCCTAVYASKKDTPLNFKTEPSINSIPILMNISNNSKDLTKKIELYYKKMEISVSEVPMDDPEEIVGDLHEFAMKQLRSNEYHNWKTSFKSLINKDSANNEIEKYGFTFQSPSSIAIEYKSNPQWIDVATSIYLLSRDIDVIKDALLIRGFSSDDITVFMDYVAENDWKETANIANDNILYSKRMELSKSPKLHFTTNSIFKLRHQSQQLRYKTLQKWCVSLLSMLTKHSQRVLTHYVIETEMTGSTIFGSNGNREYKEIMTSGVKQFKSQEFLNGLSKRIEKTDIKDN